MKSESSRREAFGFPHRRAWAIALSCTLVCAQPGILPGQAFADPSSPAQPFEASAESYVVGQELNVADSALAYYPVFDTSKRQNPL